MQLAVAGSEQPATATTSEALQKATATAIRLFPRISKSMPWTVVPRVHLLGNGAGPVRTYTRGMARRPLLLVRPTLAGVLLALTAQGACGGGAQTKPLDREALQDPDACRSCHPVAYQEWSGSMHAYASGDPVFRAMNQRAQRETNNALGDFCVKCHAPMAVQAGLTATGLDLDTLPQKMKGVTCYFCHAAESVEGTHNNPLTLAKDDSLYGPFSDPVAGTPHKGLYSRLLDGATLESASMCGSCHDIQNLQGAHVERTFEEWQGTLFSALPNGQGCADCHMKPSNGPASTVSPKQRRIHAHGFPAVDVAVTDFPEQDTQRAQAQALLDGVLQPTLCYNTVTQKMELTLENVTAGHGFPSGATPDRRVWVELTATVGEEVIFSSGTASALPLEDSTDPNLWLMRDCLFDGAGQETKMFWQATTATGNGVPGSVMPNVVDPTSYNRVHPQKLYPETGMLRQMPDRVSLKIHLKAIGDDVLADLVDSGDLDPGIPQRIAQYDLGGAASFDWTPATAIPEIDRTAGVTRLCVIKPVAYRTNTVPAVSNAHCMP
jgi:nitrate/TMAO reductase-like tetraheme cytochrome c subunit